MKDLKKTKLAGFRKELKSDDKLEKLVLDVAVRKTIGSREDLDGVFYSKNGRRVLMASKSISGSYTVCEGVRKIDSDAFWGCAYLESLVLPEGLESIGHEAFGKCISLRSIVIPETVSEIGTNPFLGLDHLKVESRSPLVTSDGNAVYADGGKRLVSFISDAEVFGVPEGVEEIGEKAFSGKSRLCSVTLPSTLKKIEDEAFFDCDALRTVVIPQSVEIIGECAFADCAVLREVEFAGVPLKMKHTMLAGCDDINLISIPAESIGKFRKLVRDYDDRVVERKDESQPMAAAETPSEPETIGAETAGAPQPTEAAETKKKKNAKKKQRKSPVYKK